MGQEARIGSIHPGEVIREEFLLPLGKNACWLAHFRSVTVMSSRCRLSQLSMETMRSCPAAKRAKKLL